MPETGVARVEPVESLPTVASSPTEVDVNSRSLYRPVEPISPPSETQAAAVSRTAFMVEAPEYCPPGPETLLRTGHQPHLPYSGSGLVRPPDPVVSQLEFKPHLARHAFRSRNLREFAA